VLEISERGSEPENEDPVLEIRKHDDIKAILKALVDTDRIIININK
jgi:hypothetical protein